MAHVNMNRRERYIITGFVFLINFCFTCPEINMGIIMSLIGSYSVPMLQFIFPGYLYFILIKQQYVGPSSSSINQKFDWGGKISFGLAILGLFMQIFYSSFYLFNLSDYQ